MESKIKRYKIKREPAIEVIIPLTVIMFFLSMMALFIIRPTSFLEITGLFSISVVVSTAVVLFFMYVFGYSYVEIKEK